MNLQPHIFLLHHTDERGRKRRLRRRFRQLGIDDVEWVETYHPRDRANWDYEGLVANGSVGETSCALKHRDALRRQVKRRIPIAVILEDDIELPDTFAADLPRWLDELGELGGDMLMLGVCFDLHIAANKIEPGRSVYLAPRHGRCTHAYAVTLDAAQILASDLEQMHKGIGHDLNDIVAARGVRMCWLEPGLRQLSLAGEMLSAISERQTPTERRRIRWQRLLRRLRLERP